MVLDSLSFYCRSFCSVLYANTLSTTFKRFMLGIAVICIGSMASCTKGIRRTQHTQTCVVTGITVYFATNTWGANNICHEMMPEMEDDKGNRIKNDNKVAGCSDTQSPIKIVTDKDPDTHWHELKHIWDEFCRESIWD